MGRIDETAINLCDSSRQGLNGCRQTGLINHGQAIVSRRARSGKTHQAIAGAACSASSRPCRHGRVRRAALDAMVSSSSSGVSAQGGSLAANGGSHSRRCRRCASGAFDAASLRVASARGRGPHPAGWQRQTLLLLFFFFFAAAQGRDHCVRLGHCGQHSFFAPRRGTPPCTGLAGPEPSSMKML